MIHFLLFAGVMLPQFEVHLLSLIWCGGSRVLLSYFYTGYVLCLVINKELFFKTELLVGLIRFRLEKNR